jgi:hypothetical protein
MAPHQRLGGRPPADLVFSRRSAATNGSSAEVPTPCPPFPILFTGPEVAVHGYALPSYAARHWPGALITTAVVVWMLSDKGFLLGLHIGRRGLEPVGGKVEENESYPEAAKRVCDERFGVFLDVTRFRFASCKIDKPAGLSGDSIWVVHDFVVRLTAAEVTAILDTRSWANVAIPKFSIVREYTWGAVQAERRESPAIDAACWPDLGKRLRYAVDARATVVPNSLEADGSEEVDAADDPSGQALPPSLR